VKDRACRARTARPHADAADDPRRGCSSPELLVWNTEVAAQEAHEEAEHLRIRVRHHRGVAALAPFGPVEHAPRGEKRITVASKRPAVTLVLLTNGAVLRDLRFGADALAAICGVACERAPQATCWSSVSSMSQEADGAPRDADERGDFTYGASLVLAKRSRQLAFSRFHIRQRTVVAGGEQRERAAGIGPAYPGWKPGALPLSYARSEARLAYRGCTRTASRWTRMRSSSCPASRPPT
jgi:hypothetical protein